jgi:hypothetical protein
VFREANRRFNNRDMQEWVDRATALRDTVQERGGSTIDNTVSIEYGMLSEEQRGARQAMNVLGPQLRNQFPSSSAFQGMNCQTRRSSLFGYPSISFQNTPSLQNTTYLGRENLPSEPPPYEMDPGPERSPSRDRPSPADTPAMQRRFYADASMPSSMIQLPPPGPRLDCQIQPTSGNLSQHGFSSGSMHTGKPNTSRTSPPLSVQENGPLMIRNAGEELEKHPLRGENRDLENENEALRTDLQERLERIQQLDEERKRLEERLKRLEEQ